MQAAWWHHLSTIQCLTTENKNLNFQTDQNIPHQIFMYIKVKQSLCFIQHHTMEMVLCHEWMEYVWNIITQAKGYLQHLTAGHHQWMTMFSCVVCVHGGWEAKTDTPSCNEHRLHWWAWSRQWSKHHDDHSILVTIKWFVLHYWQLRQKSEKLH